MEEKILELEKNLQQIYDLFNKMNALQAGQNDNFLKIIIETQKSMGETVDNFIKIKENFELIEKRLDILEK